MHSANTSPGFSGEKHHTLCTRHRKSCAQLIYIFWMKTNLEKVQRATFFRPSLCVNSPLCGGALSILLTVWQDKKHWWWCNCYHLLEFGLLLDKLLFLIALKLIDDELIAELAGLYSCQKFQRPSEIFSAEPFLMDAKLLTHSTSCSVSWSHNAFPCCCSQLMSKAWKGIPSSSVNKSVSSLINHHYC